MVKNLGDFAASLSLSKAQSESAKQYQRFGGTSSGTLVSLKSWIKMMVNMGKIHISAGSLVGNGVSSFFCARQLRSKVSQLSRLHAKSFFQVHL